MARYNRMVHISKVLPKVEEDVCLPGGYIPGIKNVVAGLYTALQLGGVEELGTPENLMLETYARKLDKVLASPGARRARAMVGAYDVSGRCPYPVEHTRTTLVDSDGLNALLLRIQEGGIHGKFSAVKETVGRLIRHMDVYGDMINGSGFTWEEIKELDGMG